MLGGPAAPSFCPDGYVRVDAVCQRDVGPVSGAVCPDGYSIDDSLGGLCARFEPALQGPQRCPEGARGVAGGCYILVARGPNACGEDSARRVGGECWDLGDPPVAGPSVCPVAPDIIVEGCFRLVTPVDGVCPDGSERTPSEGEPFECRQPVELVPGPLACAEGFTLIEGECLRRPDLVGPYACEGPTEEFGDLCLVFGSPPVAGPGTCPQAADIVNDDSGCYRVFNPLPDGNCPTSTIPITHQGRPACRQEVALVAQGLVCPDPGFTVVGQDCLIVAGVVIDPALTLCPNGASKIPTAIAASRSQQLPAPTSAKAKLRLMAGIVCSSPLLSRVDAMKDVRSVAAASW